MKDKKVILNLNNYRNWQHFMSNQVKKAYSEAIDPSIRALKLKPMVRVEFTYWKPTARRSDRSNVLCIHEKFFLDALVNAGCIEDDNDDFIHSTEYKGGEIDRDNPRVDIKIIQH